ncbi:sensor histidine kinase [Confluentibacter sediminis]|uniref:sensor histidine kinase n=1 Tax=Confluentibacter sediminis TaxID=2219045 RepID=UPI000DAC15C6|nr:histidine kinase [Confluentibacter sediminis]
MKNCYQHALAWVIYTLFIFFIFNWVSDSLSAFIRVFSIISIQMVVFYSNLKWILPVYYHTKRYLTYVVINLVFVIFGAILGEYLEERTPIYQSEALEVQQYYTEKGLINGEYDENTLELFDIEQLFSHAMPIVLIIFISYFMYNFHMRKQEEAKVLAIITAEKNFLVQQINPHFLFNTLNNIYSLTHKTSPKGSKAVLQLSKMLDYSLYIMKEGRVSLKDEIGYINNFIALFKLKDSAMNKIAFEYSNANPNQKIAPLLLIPFVENAFKHGDIADVKNGFVTIKIKTEHDFLLFDCINSYQEKKNVDKTGGIGIANVSRRLELLYPEQHELKIEEAENVFSISLKIKANGL